MLNKLIEFIKYFPLIYWAIVFLIVIPVGAVTAIVLNIQTSSFDSAINWIGYLTIYLIIIYLVIIWIRKNYHKFK